MYQNNNNNNTKRAIKSNLYSESRKIAESLLEINRLGMLSI